ncbi:hypothetical protein GIB67_034290 [Kingdonia uniflora]|uniref:Uncharacterized protein n=1 Tax=Kingdonia uniflora TaxID=39325 RepID=A0A7J7NSJ6_9MAGN|nr:hypothetical protein GIB67_034290 [Kingdonia uniflora]
MSSLEHLIKCLCCNAAVVEALPGFTQLRDMEFTPSLQVWNSTILGGLNVGMTDIVRELYDSIMDLGVVGDVDTVGFLIGAY